jgi:cytochrome P450
VSVASAPIQVAEPAEAGAPASPAGPVGDDLAIRMPPGRPQGRFVQSMRFVADPLGSSLAARRDFGDVWELRLLSRRDPFIVTCHPDHIESLFKASPPDAPSLTGESPLRPILGPNSVLTSVGPRHMRQRKLLLPAFHGQAVQRYVEMIATIAEQEIGRWPVGGPFSLAPRMQAVTLEVIMGGVFGIVGSPPQGSAERKLREGIRRMLAASTKPFYQLIELQNAGRMEPRGILKAALALVDRQIYAVIHHRRQQQSGAERHDVLSLLLQARDEEGRTLTDQELRDELMTLVLAGHETTANSLAWTFERLLRTPEPYARLRELVRADDPAADAYVEATINEGMRIRPVIPFVVRKVTRRWRMGDYVLPAQTAVAISIVALHFREDVYPDPFTFRPERFVDRKPGTYTWIPFGGGIRRCLGATLAMAEQRVVLRAIARRTDMVAPDPKPEHPRQRNVTMIPNRGGRVVVERKLTA